MAPTCSRSRCFNGAAVRRRRRAAPGARAASASCPLQRSRRPKTAESGARVPRRPIRWRGFNGAAVRRRRRAGRATHNGPPNVQASTEPPSEDGGEGGRYSRPCTRTGRFNGAAVRRRRRGLAGPRSGARSPCFNGAAVRRRRRAPPRAGRRRRGTSASTEPPSEDGGEGSRLWIGRILDNLLQRSRRPKTAESSRPCSRGSPRDRFNGAAVRRRRRAELHVVVDRSSRSRFNGAAVRRRRRGRPLVVTLITLDDASTEPPSEDGGEPAS